MGTPYYEQYEETQDMILWVRAVFIIAVVAIAVSCYYMFRDPTVPRVMPWGFVVLTALMFWSYWTFTRLTIRVGGGKLEFGFGPFRPKVNLEDIEWIAAEPITFRRYGGIGIRVGAGAVCYNTRFGNGVRIGVRGRRRDWAFTTKNPQEVARALGKDLLPDRPAHA
jgi:hypothetical protein